MLSAEERYKHDPVFHAIVEQIYNGIVKKQFSATEVRDAAMLAFMKYEHSHLRHVIIDEKIFRREHINDFQESRDDFVDGFDGPDRMEEGNK